MAAVEIEWNQSAVNALLRSTNGPVVQDLLARARRVEARAKGLCRVDTGRLRSSITVSPPQEDSTGVTVYIGTDVEYAPIIEDRYPFLEPALSAAR